MPMGFYRVVEIVAQWKMQPTCLMRYATVFFFPIHMDNNVFTKERKHKYKRCERIKAENVTDYFKEKKP